MSIDARIVGIRKLKFENEIKLTLEDRPGGGPAGQGTLRIVNTDMIKHTSMWLLTLRQLIGCDIWGGSGFIMLGDKKLGDRVGYTGIIFVDDWVNVIKSHGDKLV